MYSLPITTYSDYWRKTKSWSAYFGGVAVLVASTRYSVSEDLDFNKSIRPPLQLVDLTSDPLAEDSLSLPQNRLSKQEHISRGIGGAEEAAGAQTRQTSKLEISDKEIPYETEYIESDQLPPGASRIQEKGETGVRREVVKIFEIDGQPIDRQVQSSFELKSPKKEVIIRNTQPPPKKKVIIQKPQAQSVEADLAKLDIVKTLDVEATAYTYTGNNTATGIKPREGIIAVDPKVIAMGTKVYVEGYGYAVAADTGSAIRGNKIDVFFSTFRQCIDWGRRSVKIHILNPI